MNKKIGQTVWLAGFEYCFSNGGDRFNFILSDSKRSGRKCLFEMKDYMLPESCEQTRKVHVYSDDFLLGFEFFDSSNNLLFAVGRTQS
jgi:hypothetical protein